MNGYSFKALLKTRFDLEEKKAAEFGCENVYAHASLYKKVFRKTLKGTDRRKRFVKITSEETKMSVYRILRGVPNGVSSADGILYIDSDGKNVLSVSSAEVSVKVKSACWLAYYWHTDNTAARISFKMGIISFTVGIISLILTIALR
ncbi:MAG: hypothetical protein IJR40_03010 [Treponema sp.]|nr:hypothetical protein [Treponema sp.]